MKRILKHQTLLLIFLIHSALIAFSQPNITRAPNGFDAVREGIAHGKIDTVLYDSKTVGTKRKAIVYTPPGYSSKRKYPVFYLLHGIGGTEKEWLTNDDFNLGENY